MLISDAAPIHRCERSDVLDDGLILTGPGISMAVRLTDDAWAQLERICRYRSYDAQHEDECAEELAAKST